MKTKVLVLSAIISLGMIFQGCEKDDSISNKSLSNTKNKSSTNINKSTEAPPTGNPISTELEHFGVFHNEALDYFATNPNFPDITDSDILDMGNAYAESAFEDFDANNFLDSTAIDYNLNPFQSISSSANEAYNNSVISSNALNHFMTLEDKIYEYSATLQFNNLISYLYTYEDAIYNDNNLTNTEKDLLISSSIITRYSTIYWTNVFDTPTHPWRDILMETDESMLPQEVRDNLPPSDVGNLAAPISYRLFYDITKYVEYIADCPPDCGCGGNICLEISADGAWVASGKL